MTEQITLGLRRHALLLYEIEDDARIEVAASAAHRKAVERGEAHGRCHALAPMHRAHAGPATEMRHYHATVGDD